MESVAVLFAREDSVYKTMPGCDVYDIDRDARSFAGGRSVVAHPPCRGWSKLRAFARPAPGEVELAPWAIEQVRVWGGVLEHPAASALWKHCDLPQRGRRDSYGGWTLVIDQDWFGHKAEKRTALYICGVDPRDIPEFPYKMEEPTHVLASDKRVGPGRESRRARKGDHGWRPEVSKAEREHTPLALAEWLVDLARRCNGRRMQAAA